MAINALFHNLLRSIHFKPAKLTSELTNWETGIIRNRYNPGSKSISIKNIDEYEIKKLRRMNHRVNFRGFVRVFFEFGSHEIEFITKKT